jgi:hypothetical protein
MIFVSRKRNKFNSKILFLSGLFCGFAVIIDFPQIFSLMVLFGYLLWIYRNKRIFYFMIGAVIPILLLLSYNYVVFDDFFTSPYSHRARELSSEMSSTPGSFSVTSFSFNKLYSYLFSLKYGLFVYMPFLILSLFGFYLGFKSRYYKEVYFCFFVFLLQLFFYVSFSGYTPCSFGLRYMTPVMPFLVIPLIFVFKKIKVIYVVLFGGVSVLFNFMGPLFYYTCTKEHLFNYYFPMLFERGLTNYTFNLISIKFFYINPWITNIVSFVFLGLVSLYIIHIWKDS